MERSLREALVPPTESSLSSDVLLNRGRANGVEIHKVTGQEALELEPRVNTKFGQALYVPITSVVNPKEVAERVREEVVSRGGVIHYSTPAEAIDARRGTARTSTGSFEAGTVVNAAGLFADQVAERAGLRPNIVFSRSKGSTGNTKTPTSQCGVWYTRFLI